RTPSRFTACLQLFIPRPASNSPYGSPPSIAELLLSPENRIFSSLGDPQFEHGFRWNPDALAHFEDLRIKSRTRLASSIPWQSPPTLRPGCSFHPKQARNFKH